MSNRNRHRKGRREWGCLELTKRPRPLAPYAKGMRDPQTDTTIDHLVKRDGARCWLYGPWRLGSRPFIEQHCGGLQAHFAAKAREKAEIEGRLSPSTPTRAPRRLGIPVPGQDS